jgi:hypothetical protein
VSFLFAFNLMFSSRSFFCEVPDGEILNFCFLIFWKDYSSGCRFFCVYEISQLLQTLFAHPIENYKYLLDNLPRCFILHRLNIPNPNRTER